MWQATTGLAGYAMRAQVGLRIYAPTALAPNARLTLELPTALRGIAGNDTPHAARVVACERAPTRHGYAYQIRLAFLDARNA
jgi:hypothetical protein